MRHTQLLFLFVLLPLLSVAETKQEAAKPDMAKSVIEKSQLTLPGSPPFHIKLTVVEATNLENDNYKAEIEEWWAAPEKWRRAVKTGGFSETLIVNGDKTSEQVEGDYYPNWLRTLVAAALDPGAALQGVEVAKVPDRAAIGGAEICPRFSNRVGVSPATNTIFATYCFRDGLLDLVGKPGYHAEYKDYKKFSDKQVAHKVREEIESGTEVEATVTELSELTTTPEDFFAVKEASPRLQTVAVGEEVLRSLAVNSPEMLWPPVRGGKTAGVLSIYVCVDRDGRVRETYGLNSDHPDMTDAAREQLANWKFKPATASGNHVQVEGVLTFAYQTKIDDPYPVLTNAEARKAAIQFVEPIFAATVRRGTIATVRVLVGEDGSVRSTFPGTAQSGNLLGPILGVIPQWKFRPYLRNDKPTPFNADLSFVVK